MNIQSKLASGLIVMSVLSLATIVPVFANESESAPGREMAKTVRAQIKWGAFMGTLSSKNGDSLVINTKAGKTMTVNVSDSTKLFRRFGAKSSLDEIQNGDKLGVRGTWADADKTSINATWIRDESIQKRNATFVGTVESSTDGGFVLQPVRRKAQTVSLSSSTKITDRRGTTLGQGDIQTGNKVIVSGVWDTTSNTITEVTRVRDLSLPMVTKPMAKSDR